MYGVPSYDVEPLNGRGYVLQPGVLAVVTTKKGLSKADKARAIILGVAEADAWTFRKNARKEFALLVEKLKYSYGDDTKTKVLDAYPDAIYGGRVVVCDLLASDDPAKAAEFHRIEMLRDPSHVRALTLAELEGLFPAQGLPAPAHTYYKLPFELEGLLERSFPRPEDVETIRAAYTASVDGDTLGLGSHRKGDEIRAAYPVAILAAPR